MAQTIGQIMQMQQRQQGKSECRKPQSSCNDMPQKAELTSMYGTSDNFLVRFNPAAQQSITAQNTELCFFAGYPTLAKLRAGYGDKIPEMWLVPQLVDLSEYCGVKDKLSQRQLDDLASVIAGEFFYLKVSELLLFFRWFKAGRYGRFYGNVDPLVITTALRDFCTERAEIIDKHEREMASEQAKAAASKGETMTLEEWKKKHGIEKWP